MTENTALAGLIPTETVEPWNAYVLVRPIKEERREERTSPFGLYLGPAPDEAESDVRRGQIVALSPLLKPDDPTGPRLEEGLVVFYDKSWLVNRVTIEGHTHHLVAEKGILGVIRLK